MTLDQDITSRAVMIAANIGAIPESKRAELINRVQAELDARNIKVPVYIPPPPRYLDNDPVPARLAALRVNFADLGTAHVRKASMEHPIDQLLTVVQRRYNLSREEAIKKIGTDPSRISKIRNDLCAPSPRVILTIHDRTGIPIEQIRQLLGVQPL